MPNRRARPFRSTDRRRRRGGGSGGRQPRIRASVRPAPVDGKRENPFVRIGPGRRRRDVFRDANHRRPRAQSSTAEFSHVDCASLFLARYVRREERSLVFSLSFSFPLSCDKRPKYDLAIQAGCTSLALSLLSAARLISRRLRAIDKKEGERGRKEGDEREREREREREQRATS